MPFCIWLDSGYIYTLMQVQAQRPDQNTSQWPTASFAGQVI